MTAPFVLRMAWREGRAAVRRLALLTASITAGVAALVAINSFTDNLRLSVRDQARSLLGADLSLSSLQEFSPSTEALLDTLGEDGIARLTNFGAMAYVPHGKGVRLVQVSAVAGSYPFYGEVVTTPADAWRTLQHGAFAVVDSTLLTSLGLHLGDTLALGDGRFVLTGTVVRAPGDAGVRSALGPRVFIPARYLASTGLVSFGARVEREAFIRLAPGRSAEAIAEHYRPLLRDQRVRVRTVGDDQRNLDNALQRLGRYLGLVALIALLLGGLGVASATHVYVRQKTETIAVLRCVGASAAQVFSIYVTQAAMMGLMGSVLGAALGVALQQLLPHVLANLLPVDVSTAPSWTAVLVGVATGVWVASAFALLPLIAARRVPPLAALRQDFDEDAAPRDPWRLPALGLIGLSVLGLATLQSGRWITGLAFTAAIGTALLLLWATSWALVRGVRRWLPAGWPYVWRQGLANLQRPANQTMAVLLALGFGAFLLATLFLAQYNLLQELRLAGGPDRPNLVFFDIQPDQVAPLAREIRTAGYPVTTPVPIVPMRIYSVKGRTADQIAADTLRGGRDRSGRRSAGGWALRREYRSTYRDTLVASERIVAGRWWPRAPRDGGPVPISMDADMAADLGVRIGDTIVWDVQGTPVLTQVANLREVDWARFEPNFFVVFAPGALESAPQTYVVLTRTPDARARGALQRTVAERYANVTSLDVSLVQEAVERLVSRVVLAIRFIALFSLVTGAVVLAGAVSTSRFQRMRESALLKTLGATRRQVLQVVLAEYLAIGLLAAGAALLLALAAGWALARFLFDLPFRVPPGALLALVGAVAAVAVAIGVWGSVGVVRRTPLEALRGA